MVELIILIPDFNRVADSSAMFSHMSMYFLDKIFVFAEELSILFDVFIVFCDSIKIMFTFGVEFYQRIVLLIVYFELHESTCKIAYLYGFLHQANSPLLHRDSFGTIVTNLGRFDWVESVHESF